MSEENNVTKVANDRLGKWRGAVEQELQDLVKQASAIRQTLDSAKTATKKTYYKKKFQKISSQVMQMVAALQRLDQQKAQLDAEGAGTNDQPATA